MEEDVSGCGSDTDSINTQSTGVREEQDTPSVLCERQQYIQTWHRSGRYIVTHFSYNPHPEMSHFMQGTCK